MAAARTIPLNGVDRFQLKAAMPPEYSGRWQSSAACAAGERSTVEASLMRRSFLERLGEPERRAIVEACHTRLFRPGEVLFHEGDPGHALYLLRSGKVKIVLIAPDGKESLLHISAAGECLGELSLLDGSPRSATAVALDQVEVLTLSRDEFLTLVEQCPGVARAVMQRMAEMVRRLNHQVQDALWLDLTGRLARKLLELAEEHGEAAPEGTRIGLRLTQQELAAMVGAARSRVNRCLGEFQERGVLTVEREQITIHKPQELRKRIY